MTVLCKFFFISLKLFIVSYYYSFITHHFNFLFLSSSQRDFWGFLTNPLFLSFLKFFSSFPSVYLLSFSECFSWIEQIFLRTNVKHRKSFYWNNFFAASAINICYNSTILLFLASAVVMHSLDFYAIICQNAEKLFLLWSTDFIVKKKKSIRWQKHFTK